MTDEREGRCPVCRHRDAWDPLPPDGPCGPCRSRLDSMLREIPDLVRDLRTLGYVQRDISGTKKWPDDTERFHFDPVANVMPAGPINGQNKAPRVSGSYEKPVPANLDALDLAGPPYSSTVHDDFGDQVGHTAVAATLLSWLRDWHERRDFSTPEFHDKPDTTAQLCVHLRNSLEWACDEHPAVDEFANELRDCWLALRRANGLTEPRPELCDGVPCRSCDLKALFRVPGSAFIECACGALYTESEYTDWTKLLAASARQRQREEAA